jgi:peptide deformylase
MAILQILQYPDLRLRRKGYRVGNVKAAKIQKTIENIITTLNNTENCAGLAATQLDIEDPPNITVIHNMDNDDLLCLINLDIISSEDSIIEQEGCMSIYPQGISAKVKRANKIKVKALDRYGNKLEFVALGHLARCLQHEYDHLQGVLYVDHLAKADRLALDKQIAALK